MPPRVRHVSNKEKLELLRPKAGQILNEATSSSATNLVKHNVALWKIHQEFILIKETSTRGTKIIGERDFQEFMEYSLSKILPLKRPTPVADRVIKFVASYVKYINEKGNRKTATLFIVDRKHSYLGLKM